MIKHGLRCRYLGPDFGEARLLRSDVTADQIPILAKQSFPLCMQVSFLLFVCSVCPFCNLTSGYDMTCTSSLFIKQGFWCFWRCCGHCDAFCQGICSTTMTQNVNAILLPMYEALGCSGTRKANLSSGTLAERMVSSVSDVLQALDCTAFCCLLC